METDPFKNTNQQNPEVAQPIDPAAMYTPEYIAAHGLASHIRRKPRTKVILKEHKEVFTDGKDTVTSDYRHVWNKDTRTYEEVPVVPRLVPKDLGTEYYPQTKTARMRVGRLARKTTKGQGIRNNDMFRMRQVWGEELGTPEYEEKIANAHSFSEKRKLKKAAKKYSKLEKKAAKKVGLVKPVKPVLIKSDPVPTELTLEQKQTLDAIWERGAGGEEARLAARAAKAETRNQRTDKPRTQRR